MEIIISGRHCSVEPVVKEYITNKLNDVLDHKNLKITSAKVVVDLEKKTRYQVEVIVKMKQFEAEAVEETYNLHESIDAAIAKIDVQIRKHIDKKQDHKNKPSIRDVEEQ
ncbi:MAG: ribosomal subunit interface protein [Lentisphaerae bacterium GWF2_45_14]|nr:MAG: ribosomal subunit interface protein [Lentisphaerae bacterium GWF2_45_14]